MVRERKHFKAWLTVSLAAATTVLSVSLWALTTLSLNLNVAAGGAGGSGEMAAVTALAPSTYTLANGHAKKIQGVDLYDVTDISAAALDHLTFRFYVLNPDEMGGIFNNPNAFFEVKVTKYNDAQVVYASAMVTRERAVVRLEPAGVPAGTTQLKIRADVVVPGGRPPGQQISAVGSLATMLELSQR